MRSSAKIGLVVLALALNAVWAQDGGSETKPKESAPPATERAAAAPDYIIGAGDTLHVSVWKEPDLTATLPVRPDGKISMPLLNDVQAAGITPVQLAASITEKLKKYVSDPRVTVVVTQMDSQRVFVMGEVLHSGGQILLPNMTILQVLAGAGFTQFSNTKAIYVLRNDGGKQSKLAFNYKAALKGDSDVNFVLKPGDTVVVP
jgi:polysaccharide export outer membrane protein